MDTLKQNEKRGKDFEILISKDINGFLTDYNSNSYDIETSTQLIEIKSCILRTICRHRGRFVINPSAHSNLFKLSQELHKSAVYTFILYINENNLPKIIQTKTLSWSTVQELIKNKKPLTRNWHGNIRLYILLYYNDVFGDKHVL